MINLRVFDVEKRFLKNRLLQDCSKVALRLFQGCSKFGGETIENQWFLC